MGKSPKPALNQIVFDASGRAGIVVKPEILSRSFLTVRWGDSGQREVVRTEDVQRA